MVGELLWIKSGAEGSTDEAVDFNCSTVGFASAYVALLTVVCAVGEHGIFRSHPTTFDFLCAHPPGHTLVYGGSADHACFFKTHEHGTKCVRRYARLESNWAELIDGASIRSRKGCLCISHIFGLWGLNLTQIRNLTP